MATSIGEAYKLHLADIARIATAGCSDPSNTFTPPARCARFFSSAGTLQIRYGTTSAVDASDVDLLLITGTR